MDHSTTPLPAFALQDNAQLITKILDAIEICCVDATSASGSYATQMFDLLSKNSQQGEKLEEIRHLLDAYTILFSTLIVKETSFLGDHAKAKVWDMLREARMDLTAAAYELDFVDVYLLACEETGQQLAMLGA